MALFKSKLTFTILLLLGHLTAGAQSRRPVPESGMAEISGAIVIPAAIKKDSVRFYLRIPHPFTGEMKTYTTLLDPDGRYSLKVSVQTDISRCAVNTDINMSHLATVMIKSGVKNRIGFTYDNDREIAELEVGDNQGFAEAELIGGLNKFTEMITTRSDKPPGRLYDKPFSEFIAHADNVLQRKRLLLDNPPFLSDRMKEILFKDYTLAVYSSHVLDYQGEMVLNYQNSNDQKMPDSSEIQRTDRNYYSFLRNLDLNNPVYLYCYSYPTFVQDLLRNEVLAIPRINEMPVRDWLNNLKTIMRPLLGFDEGQFYDMLACNAYAIQFELEVTPLTARQQENIKSYFKGNALEKILLRRNEEIKQLAGMKERLVVNATPAVAREALMNAIVSRFKGKVVVVDFWATWCAPCIEAMQTSREMKGQLAGKDVVFVYLTDPTSPKNLWEKMVQGIGGQHFYLSSEEWKHLRSQFGFTGIPTYLVFDKDGSLRQQYSGYPGNGTLQAEIESALRGNAK